jgi:lysozyme family protein
VNRRAASYLMPLYTLGITLLLFTAIFMAMTISSPDTEFRVGERQEAVLDAVQRSHSVRQYAQQAASEAVASAAHAGSYQDLDASITENFARLMRAHPFERLLANYHAQGSGFQYTITSSEPIVLSIRGPRQAYRTVGGPTAGPFDTFPLEWEVQVTSLFGYRDISSGSSSNHPGLDFGAPPGTNVISMHSGVVQSTGSESVFIRHDNGWTCGYLHVNAAVASGQAVSKGDVIARVQAITSPHLDLRCYNHDQPLDQQRAVAVFGEAHVGTPFQVAAAVQDTAYAVMHHAPQQPVQGYVDPYCLFTPELKGLMANSVQARLDLTGLQYRQGDTILEKLEEPCQAYTAAGILDTSSALATAELTDSFVEAMIIHMIDTHEGGYVNHPADRGGMTNHGITQDTLASYRGVPSVSESDMRSLTKEEAVQIYKQRYFYGPNIDKLPVAIIPQVFDMTVNMGANGVYVLQETLNENGYAVQSSRRIDNHTVQAAHQFVSDVGSQTANNLIAERRITYYERVVESNPSQRVFLRTWVSRANYFKNEDNFALVLNSAASRLPTGTYSFSLEVRAGMTAFEQQLLSATNSVRGALSRCSGLDEECIQGVLRAQQNTAVMACPDPLEELARNVERCLQAAPGCSCPLLMPTSDVIIEGVTARTASDSKVLLWAAGESDDAVPEVHYVVASEQVSAVTLNASAKAIRGGTSPLPVEDIFWVLATRHGDDMVVSFDAVNITAACQTPIERKYCHGPAIFWQESQPWNPPAPAAVEEERGSDAD